MKLLKFRISDFSENQIKEFSKYVDAKRNKILSQSAIAHYKTKEYLSDIMSVALKDIQFKYNKNGKPYVENGPHFSISHSGDYIFIVFDNKEIGIDVERIRDVNPKLLGKIATDEEINNFDNENFNTEFLKLWTLKEAYFKYKGTGITDLKSVNKKQIESLYEIHTEITNEYILTIITTG